MAGSVNKVILIGNLGADAEIKTMQSGDRVATLSIATEESWKDKHTGERKKRTEWHRVVVFNQGIIKLIEDYIRKGYKLYIEGQLETRSWEQDGVKRYTTEVVLRPFRGAMNIVSSPHSDRPPAHTSIEPDDDGYINDGYKGGLGEGYTSMNAPPPSSSGRKYDELEDEIPF